MGYNIFSKAESIMFKKLIAKSYRAGEQPPKNDAHIVADKNETCELNLDSKIANKQLFERIIESEFRETIRLLSKD